MILNGGVFSPPDLKTTCGAKAKKQILSDETAIAYLAAQGYDVSALKKM
jgi:hypothetical protein